MTKVAIVRAKGDGGFQEPSNGTYISAQRDTVVGYSTWVENLVNHGKVELVEELEGSNYAEYVNYVAEADGNEEDALKAYRGSLPTGKKSEKVTIVENAADLEQKQAEEKAPAPKASAAKKAD